MANGSNTNWGQNDQATGRSGGCWTTTTRLRSFTRGVVPGRPVYWSSTGGGGVGPGRPHYESFTGVVGPGRPYYESFTGGVEPGRPHYWSSTRGVCWTTKNQCDQAKESFSGREGKGGELIGKRGGSAQVRANSPHVRPSSSPHLTPDMTHDTPNMTHDPTCYDTWS